MALAVLRQRFLPFIPDTLPEILERGLS